PGVLRADSVSVFTPGIDAAGITPSHANANSMSVTGKGDCGVKARTNVWNCFAAMLTGALGVPVGTLVAGSVVWNRKVAGRLAMGVMSQRVNGASDGLITVANTVAGAPPTCTARDTG